MCVALHGSRRGGIEISVEVVGHLLAHLAAVLAVPLLFVRPARSPALDTMNGTTKFRPQRIQVAVVWSPAAITAPWLIAVSTKPTIPAMRSVRRRFCRSRQNAPAWRARTRVGSDAVEEVKTDAVQHVLCLYVELE